MRIYTNLQDALIETERDLYEMGQSVHPQTMQDKFVGDDPDYLTKEIRGYGFKIVNWSPDNEAFMRIFKHFFQTEEKAHNALTYILSELQDRTDKGPSNPGRAYEHRKNVWNEFMHNGKFAYTYSERMNPQIFRILEELKLNPESRQGIINIHSNIKADNKCRMDLMTHIVNQGADIINMGGVSRIPCSMYYQVMIRESKVDLIYTMRSCDLLVHFPIDISLAILLQDWFADTLGLEIGTFTYFVGSLHSYMKNLKERGIF